MKFLHVLFRRLKEWWSSSPKDGECPLLTGRTKTDYELWQKWERELVDSRKQLRALLERAIMAARQVGMPNPETVGVLGRANREVENLYTRQLLHKRQTIKTAFSALGLKRTIKTPKSLCQQLEEYRSLLETRRQEYQKVHRKLSLILTLLQEFTQQKPWTANLPLQRLLEQPEIFEARLTLERSRWENQQICFNRLKESFQNRLKIGERWLFFLKNHLISYDYRLGKRLLNELNTRFINEENIGITFLQNFHKRLDPYLLIWNRKALNNINLSENNYCK